MKVACSYRLPIKRQVPMLLQLLPKQFADLFNIIQEQIVMVIMGLIIVNGIRTEI